jgi:predicted amino acid-binding ACT domain protein
VFLTLLRGMLNPTQVYVNVTQVEARAYADALHAAALADARAALKENQQLQRELQQKEVRTSIEIPIEAL